MVGLFDYEFQLEKINQHKSSLQKLDKIIQWEIFRESIEKALYVEPKASGGRPPYDKTIWLFKEQLKEKKLSKVLFELFTAQLISQGIVVRKDNADIKQGAVPLGYYKGFSISPIIFLDMNSW